MSQHLSVLSHLVEHHCVILYLQGPDSLAFSLISNSTLSIAKESFVVAIVLFRLYHQVHVLNYVLATLHHCVSHSLTHQTEHEFQ